MLQGLVRTFKRDGIERHSDEDLHRLLSLQAEVYQELFQSRTDMVRQAVLYDLEDKEKRDHALLQRAQNPVEEIFLLLQNGIKEMSELNPAYLADLQRYPEAWQLVVNHLDTYHYHLNLEVINKGILQGYFRRDINLQLVVKIILEQFMMLINPSVFPPNRYNLGEVFRSMYLYYVRGICTEKGSKLVDEYFAKNNLL